MADPADLDMPDAVPDEPRGYTAVEIPPVLPYALETDAAGNVTSDMMHWAKYCADYTTRLDQNGSFEVRPINHNDSTGEGKHHADDWPIDMRLGPPCNLPDFHPLIEKYGLQVLEAAGFVNQKIPREDDRLGPVGLLHFRPWRNPSADVEERIHPVLRHDLWRNTGPVAWAKMRPALWLASAILDDPTTLNYFYALSEPMTVVNHPNFNSPCHIMVPPATLTPVQMQATYNKMCAVRQWTTWNWEVSHDSEFNRYGMTESRLDPTTQWFIPASAVDTHQSDIYLSNQFIPLLFEYDRAAKNGETSYNSLQMMAGIPPDRRIQIRSEAVLVRTTVILTITILHEFVHAFCKAYFPKPNAGQHPLEPWLIGKRANEQGSSFEDYVFGGNIRALTIWVPPMSLTYDGMQNCSAPFGLWYEEHFDQWMANDAHVAVMDQVRPVDPLVPKAFWPVPQEWSQRLFTDGMWDDQVLRFGQRAYKLPKPDYWKMYLWTNNGPGRWTTGPERWNSDTPLPPSHPTWV